MNLANLAIHSREQKGHPSGSYLDQPLFSVREICHLGRFGRTEFYKLVSQGRLKICKLGRKTLVSREAFETFLRELGA